MGARGPKSTADMETTRHSGNVVSIERPRSPASLGQAERSEWDRIVSSQPAEWLTPGFDVLLESYCRLAVMERREAAILDKILSDEEFDEDAYSRASARLDRAARTKASLGIRLGFAHSTSYENKKTKGQGRKKPWQFEG
jgi:hypothetical protein